MRIEGPFGSLTLHDEPAQPAVFIAGGIGITPFTSILQQAAQDGSPQRLHLLYSNRRPEDAAFLAELQRLERSNANFRLFATMTAMSGSSRRWQGERTPINQDLLQRFTADLAAAIYYVAGPPGMVESMRDMLNRTRIRHANIRCDAFHGY